MLMASSLERNLRRSRDFVSTKRVMSLLEFWLKMAHLYRSQMGFSTPVDLGLLHIVEGFEQEPEHKVGYIRWRAWARDNRSGIALTCSQAVYRKLRSQIALEKERIPGP